MKAIRRLGRFLRPYRRWMILAPILMALEVAMDLIQPALIERIVDVGIATLDLALVIKTGLSMIGLALIGAAGGFFNGVFATQAAQGFGADLRDALFRKVQTLSFANLHALETGQLVTNLTNDVTQVQLALYLMLRILIRAPLLLIGSLVMVILTTPQLVFIPLGLMMLVLVGLLFIINRAYPLFGTVQQKLDALNTIMQENLAGVRVVKAFVRGSYEEQRFGVVNNDLMARTIHVTRIIAVTMPLVMLAMNVGIVGVIWFGGIQVTTGGMTTGEIISFINYLMRTLISLMIVSMIVLQVSRAQASAERIDVVLDTEPTVQNRPGALQDFAPQGRVAFERVCFSYDGAGAPGAGNVTVAGVTQTGGCSDAVLRDVSFVAEPGQTIALLGTTGSGKSSLVNLIPRFYDVTDGRITLDGVDVRDIDTSTLRRNIGIALQETVLFSGTIRDNIRYGRPEASEEEVIAAAKAAQAHAFIMRFPDGYDSMVGQRGVNLSGGQKQRIAIARALLLRPAVLILDDSTSAVDVETETQIQAALAGLMQDRTSFIIAQRISTVLTADRILVLDDGRIAAQGTHTELLASSSIYREIYDSQLGDGGTTYA
ncbi:MAG: ABC transporter ATP-binding protein [Anaerolineae bacterium]|nr:ABC transporter ATP-binding protein [Anaerolineae bacterium]